MARVSARRLRPGPAGGSPAGVWGPGRGARLPCPPPPAPGTGDAMARLLLRETAVSRGPGTAVQSVSDLAGWEFPFSGLPVGALFQISTAGKPAILHNDFSMRRGAPPGPACPPRGGRRLSGPPPSRARPVRARPPRPSPCPPPERPGPGEGQPRAGRGRAQHWSPGPRRLRRAGRNVTAGRGRGSARWREAGEVFSSFKKAGGRARPCVRARL